MKVSNVLYATLPGKYMVYSAQEANYRGHGKIEWGDISMYPFYKSLFELHKNFPAIYKGTFYKLKTNMDNNVFAFMYGYPKNQDQKSAKIRWIIDHLNL